MLVHRDISGILKTRYTSSFPKKNDEIFGVSKDWDRVARKLKRIGELEERGEYWPASWDSDYDEDMKKEFLECIKNSKETHEGYPKIYAAWDPFQREIHHNLVLIFDMTKENLESRLSTMRDEV